MTEEIGFGPHRLRLRQSKADLWEGIIVGRAKERIAAPTRGSLLGKLQAAAMAGTRGYIGLDDARHRFLRIYPDGFSDPNYLGQGDLGMRGRIVALAERTQSDLPGKARAIPAQPNWRPSFCQQASCPIQPPGHFCATCFADRRLHSFWRSRQNSASGR